MMEKYSICAEDPILVTGASGFIGQRVVAALLRHGMRNLRCFVRPSSNLEGLMRQAAAAAVHISIVEGNLLSRSDCRRACENAVLIYHLAAARGEDSFAEAFRNSVVTTRNLLDAALQSGALKRVVNVSSFAVYSNRTGRVLDESSPVEEKPEARWSPYCFAKVKQDELVSEYGRRHSLPYVTVRPGVVYGPGNEAIHSRVGIGSFGIFLHLGGSNRLPLTYVDNCADAIVLAGVTPGLEREVINILDDDLPSSRSFLRLYKREVKTFRSIYVPHIVSYFLCLLWERYSAWSHRQLPPAFNRGLWYSTWKKTRYTNEKLKQRLEWKQRIPTREGLQRLIESCCKYYA
jgi:nucleoside-diphosphate-sugar epimerase